MAFFCVHCERPADGAREVCEGCGGFRTIVRDEAPAPPRGRSRGDSSDGPVHVSAIARRSVLRVASGFDAFDRVLGGGVPIPSSIVLYGDPGAGKTTHAACIADAVARARGGEALYLVPEMPAEDVKRLASRLSPLTASWIWHVSDLERANAEIRKRRPAAIVYDSIQRFTFQRERGTDRAIDEVVWTAKEHAAALGAVVILLSRVTKNGDPAGGHDVIHDADVVLRLTRTAIACPTKNRYGATPREAKLSDGKASRAK